MIKKLFKNSVFFSLVLFCTTKPMQNIYKTKPHIEHNKYSVVRHNNNAPSIPKKRRLAYQLSYVTHKTASDIENVDFTTFWNEINNKEIEKPILTVSQVHELIVTQEFSIPCCEQTFSNLTSLQTHIVQQHFNENRYAARLQDGSYKWYSQADSATCRTIYEQYPNFFKCPECNDKTYANIRSLKRHYQRLHLPQ